MLDVYSPQVWIRGHRLRDARTTAGLRLVDVASSLMHPATLSRLETRGLKAIPFPVAIALAQRLGLPVPARVSPDTWARTVVDQAVILLEQSRLAEVLQALPLRDLIVAPMSATTAVQARILTAWAQWLLGDPPDPDHMHHLRIRAQECGAIRPALWAGVFEAVMRARAGNPDQALEIAALAALGAERRGEPVDVLVARASWGRLTAQYGVPEEGLAVIDGARRWVPASTPYGQARIFYVRGIVEATTGRSTNAGKSLRAAAAAAAVVPNFLLAAHSEALLAMVYEGLGATDDADAASLRSARYYAAVGKAREALGVLNLALGCLRHLTPDEGEGIDTPIAPSLMEETRTRGTLDGALIG